jgi:hypothetical protein
MKHRPPRVAAAIRRAHNAMIDARRVRRLGFTSFATHLEALAYEVTMKRWSYKQGAGK